MNSSCFNNKSSQRPVNDVKWVPYLQKVGWVLVITHGYRGSKSRIIGAESAAGVNGRRFCAAEFAELPMFPSGGCGRGFMIALRTCGMVVGSLECCQGGLCTRTKQAALLEKVHGGVDWLKGSVFVLECRQVLWVGYGTQT